MGYWAAASTLPQVVFKKNLTWIPRKWQRRGLWDICEHSWQILTQILCNFWSSNWICLKQSEKGRRPTEQSVFNSLVLFWSCELYSELQNRNKGTNNTLCKLRKLSKLKGDIWKRRKKDRVELQPFSKREFESSKGRNEKGEIKSFLCQKVGRWNSMLRSLSFHEYYILHHQSL